MVDSELDLDDILMDEQEDEVDISELVYPSIVVTGITIEEELYCLASNKCNKDISLPLFVSFNNVAKRIGDIELTLDSLIEFKLLGLNTYTFDLYKSKDNKVRLDLDDPSTLLSFIKIWGE